MDDSHQRTAKAEQTDEPSQQRLRYLWFVGQWPATFRALRHRNFRLFWFGQLISLIGTWMQTVAQGWLITELSPKSVQSSSLYLGLISAAGSFPMLLFTLFAGVIADRYDKRKILILTQSTSMLLAFTLGILTGTGVIQIWQVAALAMALGFTNAFDMPTRQSYIKDLAGGEDLLNAIALNSSIFNGARVLGPAIAGALIGIHGIGISGAFYLNGISYIAVIIGLSLISTKTSKSNSSEGDLWHHLGEGFRYVAGQRTILLLMIVMGFYSVFGFSFLVLLPAIARGVLKVGSSGFGLMVSFTGFGALASALLLATFAGRIAKGRVLLFGGIATSVGLLALSYSRHFPSYLVLLAIIGGGLVVSSSSINSLIQEIVPDYLRGRVVSMWTLIFAGSTPIGALYVGTVANYSSPSTVFLISGSICLAIICLLSLRAPWFWNIE